MDRHTPTTGAPYEGKGKTLKKKFAINFELWLPIAFIGFAIIATFPALMIPLGLPPEGDAVDYRIPIIKWMIRHHSYPNWPWSMVDDYPMLAEILMVPFYLISPSLVRLVPIFFYFSCAPAASLVILHATKTEFTDPKKIRLFFLYGTAWILAFRPLLIQSNLIMVDNVATFFVLATILMILKSRWAIAGVFCGLALATRYSVWPTVIALVPFYFFYKPTKYFLKQRFLFSFLALAIVSPFLTRNFLLNGNPVYPLFSGEANYWAENSLSKDFWGFLALPYRLFYLNEFVDNVFDYTLGKLFFIHFFILIYLAIKKWSQFTTLLRGFLNKLDPIFLTIFISLNFTLWFFTYQHLRFLVAALCLLYLYVYYFFFSLIDSRWLPVIAAFGIFPIASVQKDSVLLALHRTNSIFKASVVKAQDCYGSLIQPGVVIGHAKRDGTLGFFNYDFEYVYPHPYAVKVSALRSESMPSIVYGINPSNYVPWPPKNPCIFIKNNGI